MPLRFGVVSSFRDLLATKVRGPILLGYNPIFIQDILRTVVGDCSGHSRPARKSRGTRT